MKRLLAVLFSFAVMCSVSASAFAGSMMLMGAGKTPTPAAYVGPGDIVSSATAWYGLRGYNAAYSTGSNPAAVVCDTATFSTCSTINILSNGNFDTATASRSAACATACVIQSFTDQTGNGHDATCASASVCATLTFNCINTSLPCVSPGSTTAYTLGGTAITVTTGFTMSAIYNRTGGASFEPICCTPTTNSSPQWGFTSTANTGYMANSTSATFSMTTSANHINTVIFNGASSVAVVDATATTGLNPGTVGGTITGILRANNLSLTGKFFEFGIWTSTIFNSTQYGNMCHNGFAYWATSVSC